MDEEDGSRVETDSDDLPPNGEDDCSLDAEHQWPLAPHINCCAVLARHCGLLVRWVCIPGRYVCGNRECVCR